MAIVFTSKFDHLNSGPWGAGPVTYPNVTMQARSWLFVMHLHQPAYGSAACTFNGVPMAHYSQNEFNNEYTIGIFYLYVAEATTGDVVYTHGSLTGTSPVQGWEVTGLSSGTPFVQMKKTAASTTTTAFSSSVTNLAAAQSTQNRAMIISGHRFAQTQEGSWTMLRHQYAGAPYCSLAAAWNPTSFDPTPIMNAAGTARYTVETFELSTAPQRLDDIIDPFTGSYIPELWIPTGTVTVTNGILTLSGVGSSARLTTPSAINITSTPEQSIIVRVLDVPTGAPNAVPYMFINDGTTSYMMRYSALNNTLEGYDTSSRFVAPWNADTMKYWRLRLAASRQVFYGYSGDGVTFTETAGGTVASVVNAYFRIQKDTYTPSWSFDSVNVLPTPPPALTGMSQLA